MDKIRSKRLSPHSSTVSVGNETELSPQQVIDGLGPDAFGEKEPEEGARDLHKKLTEFAEQSPELSPELSPESVSKEAPEAFFLRVEKKLDAVEEDMGRPDSQTTHDQRVDFNRGNTVIHALFVGEKIPSYSPTHQTPEWEIEQKIAKVIKQYSSQGTAA